MIVLSLQCRPKEPYRMPGGLLFALFMTAALLTPAIAVSQTVVQFPDTPVGSSSTIGCPATGTGVCFGVGCSGSGTVDGLLLPDSPFAVTNIRKVTRSNFLAGNCQGAPVTFPVLISKNYVLTWDLAFSPGLNGTYADSLTVISPNGEFIISLQGNAVGGPPLVTLETSNDDEFSRLQPTDLRIVVDNGERPLSGINFSSLKVIVNGQDLTVLFFSLNPQDSTIGNRRTYRLPPFIWPMGNFHFRIDVNSDHGQGSSEKWISVTPPKRNFTAQQQEIVDRLGLPEFASVLLDDRNPGAQKRFENWLYVTDSNEVWSMNDGQTRFLNSIDPVPSRREGQRRYDPRFMTPQTTAEDIEYLYGKAPAKFVAPVDLPQFDEIWAYPADGIGVSLKNGQLSYAWQGGYRNSTLLKRELGVANMPEFEFTATDFPFRQSERDQVSDCLDRVERSGTNILAYALFSDITTTQLSEGDCHKQGGTYSNLKGCEFKDAFDLWLAVLVTANEECRNTGKFNLPPLAEPTEEGISEEAAINFMDFMSDELKEDDVANCSPKRACPPGPDPNPCPDPDLPRYCEGVCYWSWNENDDPANCSGVVECSDPNFSITCGTGCMPFGAHCCLADGSYCEPGWKCWYSPQVCCQIGFVPCPGGGVCVVPGHEDLCPDRLLETAPLFSAVPLTACSAGPPEGE